MLSLEGVRRKGGGGEEEEERAARSGRSERSVVCEARRGWLKDEKDRKGKNLTKGVVEHENS